MSIGPVPEFAVVVPARELGALIMAVHEIAEDAAIRRFLRVDNVFDFVAPTLADLKLDVAYARHDGSRRPLAALAVTHRGATVDIVFERAGIGCVRARFCPGRGAGDPEFGRAAALARFLSERTATALPVE
ncbi:hypothetical protein IU449_01345 [Nocardia higoensis]|uniref:Uncharacterized protein n=1 Tax=Nocardia higoensis TaxID=228599 RepID=A0ABS0D3Y4_9NOCA|nr:hypothetical protein [Nocardia higoensis]MBF6353206.1 hypothetical protein [Nocardia higoensis]